MIIVLEGPDAAGKMTQSSMLEQSLRGRGMTVSTLSFPYYESETGRLIGKILASSKAVQPRLVHCLMSANRWEMLDLINETVRRHDVVIMNRYCQSNVVYGMANNLDPEWLQNLDRGLPEADLVVVLGIATETSFARKSSRDRFEQNGAFLQSVAANYAAAAAKYGWRMVDGARDVNTVHRDIVELVDAHVRVSQPAH